MANPYGIPDNEYNAIVGSIKNRMDVVKKNADQDLEAGRGVSLINDRVVYYDPESDNKLYGITKYAARKNQPVFIQSSGRYYRENMGFKHGVTFYVGTHGRVITDPTGLTNEQPLGTGIDENSIMINFGEDKAGLSTETDPVFTGHVAYGITAGDITNWNTAYTFSQQFDLAGATNGDFIRYDNVSGKWKPSPYSSLTLDWSAITGKPNSGNFINNQNSADQVGNFRITGTGQLTNLGIGVTPSTDAIYISNGSSSFIRFNGSAGAGLYSGGSYIAFSQASGALVTGSSPGDIVFRTSPGNKMLFTTDGGSSVGVTWDGSYLGLGGATNNHYLLFNTAAVASMGVLQWTNTDVYLRNNVSGGMLNFGTNGANSRMIITSGGNVLIGKTTPTFSYPFEVNGAALFNGAGAYGVAITYGGLSTTGDLIGYVGTIGNTDFAIMSNFSARMTVTAGGNVLIGTTTDAGYKLDVGGTARIFGKTLIGSTVNSTVYSSFNLISNNSIAAVDGGRTLHLYIDNSTRARLEGYDYATGTPIDITLQETGGKVGIGTLIPSYKLDVTGTGRFTDMATALKFNASSDDGYYIGGSQRFFDVPGGLTSRMSPYQNKLEFYNGAQDAYLLLYNTGASRGLELRMVSNDAWIGALFAQKLKIQGGGGQTEIGGLVTLSASPASYSSGGYDVLVRNQTTGDIEKTTISTPGIDTVLAVGQSLSANRSIGGAFGLSITAGTFAVGGSVRSDATGYFNRGNVDGAAVFGVITGTTANATAVSGQRLISSGGASVSGTPIMVGNYGELAFNSGNFTYSGTAAYVYLSGVAGVVTMYSGTGSLTAGASMFTGGTFGINVSGTGTIDKFACIRANIPVGTPSTSWTGTITNFYGLYIEDFKGSTHGSTLTNAYGIYQAGATNLNIFAGLTSFGHTNTPSAKVDISATNAYEQLRLRTSYTPTGTADANGNTGIIIWDDNYVYIKTSAGYKRAALSTF